MGIIDAILNTACVLLWFNWRSARVSAQSKSSPVSLAATLKKADPRQATAWLSLVILLMILLFRAGFYWNVGTAWRWTPTLSLGAISLPFRCDYLGRMFLFSALSFLAVLGLLYSWLILLAVINRRVPNAEPFQRLIRVHLGWIERWPAAVKALLPLVIVALAWGFGHVVLVQLGIVPAPVSKVHAWEQAVVLGLHSYLAWKPLILVVCLLYLLNSYVYFGKAPIWHFVELTGANLVGFTRRLLPKVGKLDLAPLLMIVGVWFLGHWLAQGLAKLFQALPI
jgi:uncharacterized protein YggT (Ycf19 family)